MPSLDTAVVVLAGIALLAAFVNGALGYGFSSLTVPIALVFYANRVLNPAVVAFRTAGDGISCAALARGGASDRAHNRCHAARGGTCGGAGGLVQGDFLGTTARLEAIAAEHPRDILA